MKSCWANNKSAALKLASDKDAARHTKPAASGRTPNMEKAFVDFIRRVSARPDI
jgi:hypothetical protein